MSPPNPKLRAGVVCVLTVGLFGVFCCRLVDIQVLQRERYAAEANQVHSVRLTLPAQRGSIVDARGETLATDLPLRKVVADGSLVEKPDAVAAVLAGPLKIPVRELSAKLRTDRRYVVLQRQVPEASALELQQRLTADNLRGIRFEPDSRRSYPNGSLLCHLIGFTGFVNKDQVEEHGIQGIELQMDRYLSGQPGFRYIQRDRRGVEIVQRRGAEQPARNGSTVKLTVDLALQQIVEEELDAAVKKFSPEKAIAIMVRPKTGEILAMANRPNFDLNERNEAEPEEMKNRAILDLFEPGSTFKIVTVSSALDAKLVRPDTRVWCENGRWEYNRNVLRDAHPLGDLTVHDILVHSSNIGAAKLGVQLGANRLYQQIKKFGFGERTGIDLPGEIGGLFHPVNHWSAISITHIPMGHEVGVTPLQIAMAMSVIANGGKLMTPKVIQSITDDRGQAIAEFPSVPVRQVLGAEAVRQVTAALEDVTGAKGTAKGAAVPGFRVAGKTGTAQKPGPHGYLPGKYVVSFVGFMPVDDPEFVCLVMLDSARTKPGENFGGLVAGPVFANIATRAAAYLGLERHDEGNATQTTLVKQSAGVPPASVVPIPPTDDD